MPQPSRRGFRQKDERPWPSLNWSSTFHFRRARRRTPEIHRTHHPNFSGCRHRALIVHYVPNHLHYWFTLGSNSWRVKFPSAILDLPGNSGDADRLGVPDHLDRGCLMILPCTTKGTFSSVWLLLITVSISTRFLTRKVPSIITTLPLVKPVTLVANRPSGRMIFAASENLRLDWSVRYQKNQNGTMLAPREENSPNPSSQIDSRNPGDLLSRPVATLSSIPNGGEGRWRGGVPIYGKGRGEGGRDNQKLWRRFPGGVGPRLKSRPKSCQYCGLTPLRRRHQRGDEIRQHGFSRLRDIVGYCSTSTR